MEVDSIIGLLNQVVLPIELNNKLLDSLSWSQYYKLMDIIINIKYTHHMFKDKFRAACKRIGIDEYIVRKVYLYLLPFVIRKRYIDRDLGMNFGVYLTTLPFTEKEIDMYRNRLKREKQKTKRIKKMKNGGK